MACHGGTTVQLGKPTDSIVFSSSDDFSLGAQDLFYWLPTALSSFKTGSCVYKDEMLPELVA